MPTPIKVRLKMGPEDNLSDLAKQEGTIIFSSTGTGESGAETDRAFIYIDKYDANKKEVTRVRASSEHAEQATYDDSNNQIDESYIAYGSLEVDTENHSMNYENGQGQTLQQDIPLPFVLLDGDTMTGTLTNTAGFIGNLTGNVTGNVTGNIEGNLGTFKSITIKDTTTAYNTYGSSNPRIDFKNNDESEVLSLIYTSANTIDSKDLSPGSLTLVGSNGASNPYFITPKIVVGSNVHTGYALNADSALIHNWICTESDTGWKNDTHGGGIWMNDNTWVKVYSTSSTPKSFLVPGASTLRAEGTLEVGTGGAAATTYAKINSTEITFGSTTTGANGNHLITANGRLVINVAKNNSDNEYNEGIRINRIAGTNKWTGVTIGGADGSTNGTGEGVWFIGTQNGTRDLYISHNGRGSSATLCLVGKRSTANPGIDMGFNLKPRLTINGNDVNTTYTLYVNGGGCFVDEVNFEGGISLHSSSITGVPNDTGIKLPTLSSYTIASSSFGWNQVQFYKDIDTGTSKSRTGRQAKASAILTFSGEAATNLTHQLSFDISNKTDIDGNLYHRVGNSAGWESWRILLDNTNVSWSDWTAGSTAGPKANISLGGTNIESAAIPSATGSASGIVTTGEQTFGGKKIFNGEVVVKTNVLTLNDNITLGKGTTDATARQLQITNAAGTITISSAGSNSGNRKISFGSSDAIVVTSAGAVTFTGALSGNATTATTLATSRTINGTNFNGSANITTDKWGYSRNISISDSDGTNTGSAVGVDGSAAATLKLPATIKASLTGTATKATADASGNVITTTYATKTELSTLSGTVNNLLSAADAMIFKGTLGTGGTITSLPSTHEAGWTYKIITAGSYAGKTCEVGDMIICIKDRTTANNDDWVVVQTNIDGAVVGPPVPSSGNTVGDGTVVLFNGTSGRIVKQAGTFGSTTEPVYVNNGILTKITKVGAASTADTATSATTATNLAGNPSLSASGNAITVTAGNKTSSTFTVPYATSAGSATTATNLAGKPSFGTSGTTNITLTVGGQTSTAFTVPYATSAGTATSATTATNLANKPSISSPTSGTNANKVAITAGGQESEYVTIAYASNAGYATSAGTANSATSATSATTATNLASKPSFGTSGNNITLTAGGQTSSAFTVPYATSAGSATTANSATTATSATSATTATKANKANLTSIINAVAYYSDTQGSFACNGVLRLGNSGAQIYSMVSGTSNEPSLEFYRYNTGSYAARIYADSSGLHIIA